MRVNPHTCVPPRQKAGALASYAPQVPAVFAKTLKQNVLFGLPYKPALFDKALVLAELVHDLRDLPDAGPRRACVDLTSQL